MFEETIDMNRIPDSVAIIMDGNGRWAKKRYLPRIAGHKRGMNVVEEITTEASNLGIKVLTLYAFSTENWKRPAGEVNYIMSLPSTFFDKFIPKLIKNNVKVQTIGDVSQLPDKTREAVSNAIEETKACTGMILNFALNYGSRLEILNATKKIATEVKNGNLNVDDINDVVFSNNLETSGLKDPDLLIRTSGEERISNFLLWQIAYSELVFVDKLWPEYHAKDFRQTIIEFQKRKRRFGGLINK
ncbi:isoprenyl transferase [Fructilactobacillus sanfranciscensis]|uniref:isoprenyl transferase n=1 Tax=Fructilactobacillus sanfranciscensis TaxID=1625 RepID=UPI0006F1B4B7|nr:isoprenyl transferase [Fructilactobacillus sanfranciscensis]KRM80663.1 UDP pyrophosphate synthetase [Fructilactobacillus sanfranciscensis DSM 20451]MCG7195172.1 isoprenyl transferase [Fructilactobacillus sanfranciscensis]MDN4461772.1 isoprenyl transferase [Fructilactobacillus sanfranciscensis]NDR61155.1 isoprenyl transferase [Fructilactobacillus sanfranciscensis]POH09424.1 isoprenyl transferase [Fructilactobacillus sanfranciscensis]